MQAAAICDQVMLGMVIRCTNIVHDPIACRCIVQMDSDYIMQALGPFCRRPEVLLRLCIPERVFQKRPDLGPEDCRLGLSTAKA